jgi:hypothetical protein
MRPRRGEVLHFSEDPSITRSMAWTSPATLPGDRDASEARTSGASAAGGGEAGIQLRVLPNLWAFWGEVIVSTLDFSGIRLRNALPPRG